MAGAQFFDLSTYTNRAWMITTSFSPTLITDCRGATGSSTNAAGRRFFAVPLRGHALSTTFFRPTA
ncbi:MAG: hypothetical protein ACYC6H_05860 [Bellilinea sp.]